jgi:hypothetical protein
MGGAKRDDKDRFAGFLETCHRRAATQPVSVEFNPREFDEARQFHSGQRRDIPWQLKPHPRIFQGRLACFWPFQSLVEEILQM